MYFIRVAMIAALVSAGLSACGSGDISNGVNDPLEGVNRVTHGLNKGLDTVILRPVATVYGTVVPEPVQRGVDNFAGNAGLPGSIVNDILQANLDDAAYNFMRLLVNTTIGIGGIFDPASAMDLTARDSDFGETLHVWGFAEGIYVELPFFGPSTGRDTVGTVADILLNPIPNILTPEESRVVTGAGLASRAGDRYRFRDTIDSVLYDSADSYAQLRLNYLDSRRYRLGGGDTLDGGSSELLDELYDFDSFEE